ncbi:hypothetical protein BV20DRAFT_298421 [Pilatotrama ljubarskyi]|nr:hypothetical protein BV20DRAFT_298421 [Pilatotrama ljubarskyi]
MLRFTISHATLVTVVSVLFHRDTALVAAVRLVNRTIDDQNGDSVTGTTPNFWPAPGVDPNSTWIQGIDCVHCSMLPHQVIDVSQTFDGTWHDSTYHPGNPDRGLTASFSGTAVYVFFIVPNFVQYTTTFTNLSFSVDGTYMNQYTHNPDSSSTILYKVPVFTAATLANTDHTIEIRASGPTASILLFDYIAYTVEEVDPSSNSPSAASAGPPPSSSPSTSPSTVSSPPSPPSSVTGSTSLPGSNFASRPASLSTSSQTSAGSSPTSLPSSSTGSSHSSTHFLEPSPFPSTAQLDPPAGGSGPASGNGQRVHIGAIVGAVAGAVAFCALLALLLCFYCRRRRRAHTSAKRAAKEPKTGAAAKTPAKPKRDAGQSGEHGQTFSSSTHPPLSPLLGRGSLPPRLPAASCGGMVSGTSNSPASEQAISGSELSKGCTLNVGGRLSTQSTQSAFAEGEDGSSSSIPDAPSTPHTGSSRMGTSILRAQVAVLQSELARLRDVEQEMHQLFAEPPPRYEE